MSHPVNANNRSAWDSPSRAVGVYREAVYGHESCQLVRDLVETGVGIVTNSADRGEADDDDQSKHDRILNGGRAIFALQEGLDVLQHAGVL